LPGKERLSRTDHEIAAALNIVSTPAKIRLIDYDRDPESRRAAKNNISNWKKSDDSTCFGSSRCPLFDSPLARGCADTGWQNLDDVSADTSNWKFDPGAHTVMLILPASPSTHEIAGSWKVRTADDPVGRCQPNLLNSGVFSIILNHCDLP
jgi:hypothetical protein